ncbi:hypothetical protein IFM58399_10261 [Aspergillus lentulus]|uniref:Uncharacterized protein n=1 Tax=Aspergillus lentulus TaxID=293939 RepID=A0ABQ1B2F7_ASPLE|nr:uncharacterized protein IFM58399_10261 [Aspergillus lentulus]KAF4169956.1 hypothetical protein CNMCM6936_005101 [Aspergillus lentulus]KAF4172523.1 hypothetical protein CNMCM8060_001390 [Aspergillus lentulus]KAF4191976.1 hypothetical protein CNMCM8694_001052 [Aspergillus lentulus]GFF56211.1 hypothetical protein IFM58399_10261 [Aspergillus lentulus]GFF92497.1 hypothetical protein IFM60648_09768 [Aspergillus lentulus]
MSPNEYNLRLRWADELGIEFLGPVERARWPQTHERLFADVHKLGRRTYDNFVESISIDSIEKPWRNLVRRRADRLRKLADYAWEERKNESSWRFAVENEIMHRFSVEVACPKCRNRLWESEIPAATGGDLMLVESLQTRRQKRKPCRCPPTWGQNQYDSGINMLFSDRAEEKIRHDPPLPVTSQPEKRKHYEKPDRVYGLKQTDNFKLLLDSDDKRGATTTSSLSLRETIEVSPFQPEGKPLLYPFLIIEAKSSKGADRAEVNMQTAFVIRRLLNVQLDLKLATGEETQWESGPLVWFLAWRGEIWDLSAAFVIESENTSTRYPVVDLWSGNIRYQDGALQLLLIIDYIFDWARDIYRPAILAELNTLSTGDITAGDTNVFSTISRARSISSWLIHAQGTPTPTVSASMTSVHHNLDYLNISCPEGAIRDASILESHYLALQLLESDVDDFLLSFASIEEAQTWLQDMLKCLSSSWRVSAETLGILENIWTTEARLPRDGSQHDEVFYVRIAVHMFVSHKWEPTRQLTCLCISEGALQKLLLRMESLQNLEMHQNPIVSTAAIEALLCRILNQSIMDNLTAAVSMLCISSGFDKRDGAIPNHLLVTRSNELRVGFRHDKSPYLINLVSSIYKNHRIGQRQPRDPYIAFSHLQSKQNIVYRGDEIQMWPRLPPLVREERWKCVMVDGISENKEFPKRGLYVFDSPLNHQDLLELPSTLWRHGLYFRTMQVVTDIWDERYFRYLNIPIKLKGEWNSKADFEAFIDWKQSLQKQLGMEQQADRPGDSASLPMIIC